MTKTTQTELQGQTCCTTHTGIEPNSDFLTAHAASHPHKHTRPLIYARTRYRLKTLLRSINRSLLFAAHRRARRWEIFGITTGQSRVLWLPPALPAVRSVCAVLWQSWPTFWCRPCGFGLVCAQREEEEEVVVVVGYAIILMMLWYLKDFSFVLSDHNSTDAVAGAAAVSNVINTEKGERCTVLILTCSLWRGSAPSCGALHVSVAFQSENLQSWRFLTLWLCLLWTSVYLLSVYPCSLRGGLV